MAPETWHAAVTALISAAFAAGGAWAAVRVQLAAHSLRLERVEDRLESIEERLFNLLLEIRP